MNLETTIGYHCAPTLYGLKPANLISLNRSNYANLDKEIECVKVLFFHNNIKLRKICSCERSNMYLVYNEGYLERVLKRDATLNFLKELGYPTDFCLDKYISELELKFEDESFPHEIGLFLGYPIEDVQGYWENAGKNYKYTGYWKVYGDATKAELLFKSFTDCRMKLMNKLSAGLSLAEAYKI